MLDLKSLQLQYEGFLNTPTLWFRNEVKNLHQLNIPKNKTTVFDTAFKGIPRLGKLVERFVSNELQQNDAIDILVENIQIQDNKITLGELDCLILKNHQPIHLEIIYKFYLYNPSVGTTEIEHWIGPNKKDSLHQKLEKLINKQLPLLYNSKTKPLLDSLNVSPEVITQKVYFKAQLFVPLKDYGISFPLINNNCIVGFYLNIKDISLFENCKFHIPTKHNWLVTPHTDIDWLTFINFKADVLKFINEERAPLCWLKKPNGELFKFFVVWW